MDNSVGWDDVLKGPAPPPNAGAQTPSSKQQPTQGTSWDDVLSAKPSVSPQTLTIPPHPWPTEHNEGPEDQSEPETPAAAPEQPGFFRRLFRAITPTLLKPEERTGTHLVAAPGSESPEAQANREQNYSAVAGEYVPQSAVRPLAWLHRNVNVPLNRAFEKGAEAGGELGQEAATAPSLLSHAGDWLNATLPSPYGAKPPVSITPEQQAATEHPNVYGAAGGIGSVVGGAIADPRNWPFFASGVARPLLQRLISGGFGAMMGKAALDSAQDLYANWEKYTPAQRAEKITEGGLSGLMATGSLTHALAGGETLAEPRPTTWEDVIEEPKAQAEPTPKITTEEPRATTPQAEVTSPSQPTATNWDTVLQQPQERLAPTPTPEVTAQPGPGSPEYEALKARVSALEQKIGTPATPTEQGTPTSWEDVLQEPAAQVSTARQPIQMRNGPALAGEYGSDSIIKTPSSDIPAKYKVVEASALHPSHNAETFAPNPAYPPGVQERAYHTSKEAQGRVVQQAQNYDPRYTVNTNPDAVNGPPIVTPDGTVLGGNSRTMSTQRLYARGQGDVYRDYLRQNAQQFGLSPEAVDRMQNPVLVREMAAPADLEAARRLGSELNKNMTGALGTSERAVSAGKSITPESLSQISAMLEDLGPDSSIRDLLRQRGRDVLSFLTHDGAITERERPQFVDTATGGLSEEGKQFAERALLGTVVDDPVLMDQTPKSVLNKLDGSLADIASIAPRADEWNVLPLVREAIAEHADIAQRGLDVETHLAQQGMFGPERNEAVDAIVRKLAEKPKSVREAFRNFAQDANVAKEGQGFLAMVEPPTASRAFNDAFGTNLTQAEYEQSIVQSLEREAAKGTEYAGRSGTERQTSPVDAGVRSELAQEPLGGAQARTEPRAPTAAELAEADRTLTPSPTRAVASTLAAHTPFSVAKIALDRLNKFYDQKIAEPLIQDVLKTGRTHPEVERADPQLAEDLRLLDNSPKYFRQKAQAIIRNVTDGLDREQERLFTLMADADSRENLRVNHPEEYREAQSDPAVTAALRKYKPYEKQLTEARQALGGEVIDDDYLRRVYDKYTAGINKPESAGRNITAYDRVIRPQRADKLGREAEAEYHYQNGLHELGPAFGTKYVATMIKLARDRAAREFLAKATAIEQGDILPRQIEYNGKVYYSPDAARDMREAGKHKVETYGVYSPSPFPAKPTEQRNLAFAANRYLGPRAVVDALNGFDAPGAADPSAIKRFFQEQTVGLGFGIPHMANILRRVVQSAPGGAINPVGWVRALKVAFSRELKARGIAGVNDPTFDRLARFGAISSDSEVSSFKKFAGGNLNPANWIRPFSKLGHDFLFKPGAIDQRARIYIADLVKSQHPEFSDSQIAQTVNEQLGNYNRANWTKMQTQLSRFVLFPGWDMSSLNWVLRHPIKTSVPPALLIWAANRTINALGGNRESDRNDFFAVHAGNRAFNTNLIREPLGVAVGGPALRFGQSLVEGKSPTRAVSEASRGLARDITRPLGMLRPDLGAAIELGTNRQRIGTSREIYKSSDFATPGHVLPNAGLEKIALHTLTRMLPQAERISQAADNTGPWDVARFVGGNLGVTNYQEDPESRLRKKMAIATDYGQSKSAVAHSNPQALRQMFNNDPDAAVYLAFRPSMSQALGQLRKIDQGKELISNSSETPERKQAAIAALDKARGQELANVDKIDRAVDIVLQHVHQR